jgi:copper(I)-binding protein
MKGHISAAAKAAAAPTAAAALVLGVLIVWVLSGAFGTVARERIEIADARAPLPTSPGLTAVYLTVSDTGAEGDELVSAQAADAQTTMLTGEREHGGAGVMTRLTGITIPAHGSVTLGPYTEDIMLEGVRPLRVGQTVTLILTFRTLGTLTVPVNVVAPGAS